MITYQQNYKGIIIKKTKKDIWICRYKISKSKLALDEMIKFNPVTPAGTNHAKPSNFLFACNRVYFLTVYLYTILAQVETTEIKGTYHIACEMRDVLHPLTLLYNNCV
jgi:hypothetical protein